MADREKVIKGLDRCYNGNCDSAITDCPYKENVYCVETLARDALALIKEQEEQYKKLDADYQKMLDYIPYTE